MAKSDVLCFLVNFVLLWNVVVGQEEGACYGAGSIVASVLLTLVAAAILAAVAYLIWKKFWKPRNGQHLILETDPEKGKGEYAFDNPGFKDAGLTPVGKALENGNKTNKWNQWSPLGALSTKNEKRRTQDDSVLEDQVKVVSLRSHDFTGLGFNICGNMKDGIYIKDVLHRGPASESRKLNAGDRIHSVTISFEHMVYEDALNILSYASPYEVIVTATNGKPINFPNQSGTPGHPIYRSSSSTELTEGTKASKKRLFQTEDSDIGSNYSSLQKTRSTATTLERSKSKSPKPSQMKPKIKLSPDQLKSQLEQNIMQDYKETMRMKNDMELKIESETQKSEKYFKFGVQVLPVDKEQRSPKSAEHSQNDNNINLEKSIDEVDKKVAPPVKKREKINKDFSRENPLNDSGIKRDENNIPLELPNNMLNAALVARKNRKSMDQEDLASPKKMKGKAPAPPENLKQFDDDHKEIIKSDYNSDSDIETDNQSSVNTIELNASDITIHQENEEKQNRKTASTGDLTKIRKISTGTLERAQSLDITDTSIPALAKKRKAGKIEDFDSKTSSDESLYGSALMNKEPRLSLILNGLNTFQRSRLKKSTEWGNLEDAILNVEGKGSIESVPHSSYEDFKLSAENLTKNFNFGAKSPEFDALVNKINEIKQETIEIIKDQDRDGEKFQEIRKTKNQIWPEEEPNVFKLDEENPKLADLKNKLVEGYIKPKLESGLVLPQIDDYVRNKVEERNLKSEVSKIDEVNYTKPNIEINYNKPNIEENIEVNITRKTVEVKPNIEVNIVKPNIEVNTTRKNVEVSTTNHDINLSNIKPNIGIIADTAINVCKPSIEIDYSKPNVKVDASEANYNKPNIELNYNKANVESGITKQNIGGVEIAYNKPKIEVDTTKPNIELNYNKSNIETGFSKPNVGLSYDKPSVEIAYSKPQVENIEVNYNKPNIEVNYNKPNIEADGRNQNIENRKQNIEINYNQADLEQDLTTYTKPNVEVSLAKNTIGTSYVKPNIEDNYTKPNIGVHLSKNSIETRYANPNIEASYAKPNIEANYTKPNIETSYNKPNFEVGYTETSYTKPNFEVNFGTSKIKPNLEETLTNKYEVKFNTAEPQPGDIDVWHVEKVVTSSEPIEFKLTANSHIIKEDIKPEVKIIKSEIPIAQKFEVKSDHKPMITKKITKPDPNQVNDFILAEREASSKFLKLDDTNVSDDIKVSRHSLGSLERMKFDNENVSNIMVSDEVSIMKNEAKPEKERSNVIVSTPDLIKNITIAEAIHDLNNEVTVEGPTSLTFEIPSDEYKLHNGIQMKTNGDINKVEVAGEIEKNNSSLTYITEIQVLTPNNEKNISEIEIIPKEKNLEQDFETYIKNFESNIKNFENNIHSFEQNIQDVVQTVKKEQPGSKSISINDQGDPEKELLKVQEIVEEQLKKLPEMRFTTSSYESQIKPPEKRQSQIEILRSNFEKTSPPRMARSEISPPKSRIPVLNKTPPTSPERRDSKNLETEPDKDLLEMMSSHIPMTSSIKYQPNKSARNVTVTSIRSNSKIPSGLPTYSSRPPVPPRKIENDDHTVQISTNGDSFRQWVFNPSDSVTNITVTESTTKYEK